MNTDEEVLYETAAQEVAQKRFVPGLMAKAFSDAQGDQQKTYALYIRYRVEQLRREVREQAKQQRERKTSRDRADQQEREREWQRKRESQRPSQTTTSETMGAADSRIAVYFMVILLAAVLLTAFVINWSK